MRSALYVVTLLTCLVAGYTFVSSWFTFLMTAWFVSPMIAAIAYGEISTQGQEVAWEEASLKWKGSVLGAAVGASWATIYFLILWVGDIGDARTGSSTSGFGVFLVPLWGYPSGILGGVLGAFAGYLFEDAADRD